METCENLRDKTANKVAVYFDYPFSVTMIEEVRKNILFPAVTICLSHWVNSTRLCSLRGLCDANNRLSDGNGGNVLQYDVKGRINSAHKPHELLSCFMRSSVSSCESYECADFMEMTYFRQPAEMCYTIDMYQKAKPKDHPLNLCSTLWNYDLTIFGRWEPNLTLSIGNAETFPLIIHKPLTVPPERLSSIMIEPGMDYTISVTQNKIRRLPKPYASRCTDYLRMGWKKTFYGYLDQNLCVQECRMEIEAQLCGCIRNVHEFSHRVEGSEACNRTQEETCDRKLEGNPEVPRCDRKCGAPCEEVVYDVRLTSLAEEKTEDSKHSFRFTVKFASYSQRILEYQPVLSIVEMFGYMGGYIGIWLGFSLLSVLLGFNKFLWKIHERRQTRLRM
ncbi:amiloride-sensitive sodium channel subunit alpha-like [Galendromus occidentalis]|uniref:Amiloride-sensitive sodium channel subunit alpha-like n=1 Tax=Galendromus occidentalis TaxID=34638 RepID=A0AAJ7L7I4_9ACAR|nr:amiloride-sensitive sodium channel subunit alpha-like [Galendromus occidentalis]